MGRRPRISNRRQELIQPEDVGGKSLHRYEYFAEAVWESRVNSRYSQKQLGELVGVSRATISRWERGVSLPSETMLQRLVNAMDHGLEINLDLPPIALPLIISDLRPTEALA